MKNKTNNRGGGQSDVEGDSEEVRFQLTFKWGECVGILDVKGQGVPEGWCGSGKCTVPQCEVFGLGDGGSEG